MMSLFGQESARFAALPGGLFASILMLCFVSLNPVIKSCERENLDLLYLNAQKVRKGV